MTERLGMRILKTFVVIYPSGYGYGVTLSVKLDHRARLEETGTYNNLTWGELEDVVGAELAALRPGWAVGEVPQNSLWESDGDVVYGED